MLSDELLEAVRTNLGSTEVDYSEPPQRLEGGFFTENHAFALRNAPPPWDKPLVVRLFPSVAPSDSAIREAAIQGVLVGQGYPAPNVVLFDDDARLDRRRFFVMERLPGTVVLGGVKLNEIARAGWLLAVRLPSMTASLQAWLHRLDITELSNRLGDIPAGIERWFAVLGEQVRSEFQGLRAGLEWLVDNQPRPTARLSLCHGDLWAGNILTVGDRVTGVLDYGVATIGEPSLDVAFTTMSLCIAPISASPPVQRMAARFGSWMARRYVHAYVGQTGADLSNQRYYEALRCIIGLSAVVSYRLVQGTCRPQDIPRPTWDAVAEPMVGYFRTRTGVTLELPPAPPPSA